MNLFNTAILVTAAAAVVLLVKLAFGNRITPRGHMLMWILVAASVLAVPLAEILPESDFSAKTYLPQSYNTTETVWVEPYENLDARGFGIEGQGNYYTVQKEHVSMQVPFTGRTVDSDFTATVSRAKIENYVWIAGAAAVLLLMLAGTVRQKRKLKALPCMDDANARAELDELKKLVGIRDVAKIQIRSGADSTFLTFMGGQYLIALEDGYTQEERRRVLAHELTHLAHGDLIYNLISAFFLAAFWWNPVIWLAFRRFRRDMEVYCDYDAVRKTGDKKGYAETLVRAAAGTERFILGTTSFIGGEKEVSARVKALAAFKKPKIWIAVLAALALLCACVCFVVNPKSSDPCIRFFHDIQLADISFIRIERDAGHEFNDDFIRIDDVKQQKELLKLFRTFDEGDFTDGEPVKNENDFKYKLKVYMYTMQDSVTLLQDEAAGDDVYCIYTWPKEEGEKDLGISGKRVHSPKLTELLKEYEDTNLHMAFHAAAESTEELLLYISNCEYDNPSPVLIYDTDYRLERYIGKDASTYADNQWEKVSRPVAPDKSKLSTETLEGTEGRWLTIDLAEAYGKLPEGSYRITKQFTQKLKNGKEVKREKAAVFEWVENRLHFVDWDFLLSQPDGDLNEETKDELNRIFERWGKTSLYCYFTSAYSSPDKMDFFEFLRYYPQFDDVMGWTPELKAKFEDSEYWSPYRKDGWTVDNFITPVKPYDPAGLNRSLEYYAGITLDDIRTHYTQKEWNQFYAKDIDRYITFTSDAGGGKFIVTEGKKSGDTVTLVGETLNLKERDRNLYNGDGTSVLTLKEKDGRYLIQSLAAK